MLQPMRSLRFREALLVSSLALVAACSPGGEGRAQSGRLEDAPATSTAQVPTSTQQMRLSFAPVARRVSPAVVNISSRQTIRDPRADAYFQAFGVEPRPRIAQSLGSGAIVRPDGIIVTNAHVIGGQPRPGQAAPEIVVTLPDRREFNARVLLADTRLDLAILKIDPPRGETLPSINIDDRQQPEVGDLVLAIGDPFGVGQTVTSGIVSAVNRSDFGAAAAQGGRAPSGSFIQTDAAINPGNSGGPLVDMDGDLVGVNTFILSGSGTSAGVGFAIPAALVRRVVDTAVGGGRTFARPWLGVRLQPVTADVATGLGLRVPQGVVVTDVYPDSSAARAGLRQGDVILSIDGQPVNDEAALNFRLQTEAPGAQAQLRVLRDRREQTLGVRLEPPPARPARDERVLRGDHPLTGVTVVNLSPAVADQIGADPFVRAGPLILEVPEGTFAQRAGFQRGDIIRSIDGQDIGSTAELASALSSGTGWQMVVERQGRLIRGQFGK